MRCEGQPKCDVQGRDQPLLARQQPLTEVVTVLTVSNGHEHHDGRRYLRYHQWPDASEVAHHHTIAGNMSQSSHQYDWRASRRAVNLRTIAIAARTNVAMLTPSMRGTWLADRSMPAGGDPRPAIIQERPQEYLTFGNVQ